MIELLLQAERSLVVGLVDQAERLYHQAADADPRNSIAVVGLARVALERGDEPEAWRQARRALAIDPENVAAQRLAGRLEEVWAYQGRSLPEEAGGEPASASVSASAGGEPARDGAPDAAPDAAPVPDPPTAPTTSAPDPDPPRRQGMLDRLLRRRRT